MKIYLSFLIVSLFQEGGGNMATSTFTKQFSVDKKKANEFVAEMSKKVTPTLQPDFKSNLVRLSQDNELKKNILAALND